MLEQRLKIWKFVRSAPKAGRNLAVPNRIKRLPGKERMAIKMKLINIGFGNMVNANRLVAIVSPESAPIKRIIQDCKERGTLIDATHGRRTRAVIITDSDHVILTYLQSETVANRLNDDEDEIDTEEDAPDDE